jgi:hypothetical protein
MSHTPHDPHLSAPGSGRSRAATTWLAIAAATTVAAVVVNVIIRSVADAADASLVVTSGDSSDEISAGVVIFATVVPLVAGFVVTALLALRWPGVIRVAQVVGGVLAVLSMASPLAADTDGGTSAALAVMHVTTGAAFVLGLEVVRRRLVAARSAAGVRAGTGEAADGSPQPA